MAHQHLKTAYHGLVERINRFPQGAPPSELLYGILKMLFSERDAELVSLLPIRPFDARRAAALWKMGERRAGEILDGLADRGILLDIEENGNRVYVMPPPMAGFFEFSLMRLRDDLDQKALSELYYQYINVEEDFIKALFVAGETQLGRALVHEPAIPPDSGIRVLDYERASHIIKTATCIGIAMCYCRHKMAHVGKACDAPMDICMTFNHAADSLIRHGIVRPVTVSECMGLLERAYENNLVQFGENVQKQVSFICNCCGCCCEAMIAARKFAHLHPVHTTCFLPAVDEGNCTGCGRCVSICPIGAVALVSAADPRKRTKKKARVDEDACLGCGLCVRTCKVDAMSLRSRSERVITPIDSARRLLFMAVERGKLQNLIFDTQALRSHRAMAAILGAILKLPPVKRALASSQMKSRYLNRLIDRYDEFHLAERPES
ncbi:MAG TPA: 4Fe-4S dicluster-binding protein [Syntrophales bacterium]|nr:4Fe-4S dicluster-binding protein [Syntrophales bacterium]